MGLVMDDIYRIDGKNGLAMERIMVVVALWMY